MRPSTIPGLVLATLLSTSAAAGIPPIRGVGFHEGARNLTALLSDACKNTTTTPTTPSDSLTSPTPITTAVVVDTNSTTAGVYYPPNGNCTTYRVAVPVNRTAWVWAGPRWVDNYGLADFVGTLSGAEGYTEDQLWLTNGTEYAADHEIAATVCEPRDKSAGKEGMVLMASHALGYGQQYWNVPVEPDTHNFAKNALSQGYSVMFYDRLGVGNSTLISGFDALAIVAAEVQATLVSAVRNGTAFSRPAADKLVLVSHGYSATVTAAMLAVHPETMDLIDGLVMQGVVGADADAAVDAVGVLAKVAAKVALKIVPGQFTLPRTGYVTWLDKFTNMKMNYKMGNFTKTMLDWDESNKTPLSPLELLTQATLSPNSTAYAGPVLLVNGEHDAWACDGLCAADAYTADAFRPSWANASAVEVALVPGCGASLNLCTQAPDVFARMWAFFNANGL